MEALLCAPASPCPDRFGELKADLIESGVWTGNVNSVRSIESYGFQFDREEEKWNEKYGKTMTMRYYVMTRELWQSSVESRKDVLTS